MLDFREKFMKNAKNAKIKPFGLFKRRDFSPSNLDDKENSKRSNGQTDELFPFQQEISEPYSTSEQDNFTPPEEEQNAFLSFCNQHDKIAKRLKKR